MCSMDCLESLYIYTYIHYIYIVVIIRFNMLQKVQLFLSCYFLAFFQLITARLRVHLRKLVLADMEIITKQNVNNEAIRFCLDLKQFQTIIYFILLYFKEHKFRLHTPVESDLGVRNISLNSEAIMWENVRFYTVSINVK